MSLLTVVDHPVTLLEKTEQMLLTNEAKNNLMLGLLYQALKNQTELEDYFFAYVEIEDHVQMAFIKTPGKNLIMSCGQLVSKEVLKKVITELLQQDLSIPGIIGERELATSFATIWKEKTDVELLVEMEQLIYQLDDVIEQTIGPGSMRLATIQDIETISKWIYEFSLITPDKLSIEIARNKAEEFINDQTIYLWLENDSVVSMAKKSRPTKNGIVVTLVYTPKEIRKRGYATSLVASLSMNLLQDGYMFCSLYTDLANPTSNHIYRKIGYKPISESIMYSFKKYK